MPIRKQAEDKLVEMSVNLLNFTGERSRPSLPGEISNKGAILGKGHPPAELIHLAQTREHYIRSTNGEVEPEIRLERVHDVAEPTWRLQISDSSVDVLPGRTAVRERPEKI